MLKELKSFSLRWGWLYLVALGLYLMPDCTPFTEKYFAGIATGIFMTMMWQKV